eukprot:COSAG04_NODE_1771_length_5618_cov_50.466932_6_plen_172_part_00
MPKTLLPVLKLWFGEFWPVLESTMERFTNYLASPEWEAKAMGGEGDERRVAAGQDLRALARLRGGAVTGRPSDARLPGGRRRGEEDVQRLSPVDAGQVTVMDSRVEQGESAVRELLGAVGGSGLHGLGGSLAGCRARKQGGLRTDHLRRVQMHRQLCKPVWRTEARSWSGT